VRLRGQVFPKSHDFGYVVLKPLLTPAAFNKSEIVRNPSSQETK